MKYLLLFIMTAYAGNAFAEKGMALLLKDYTLLCRIDYDNGSRSYHNYGKTATDARFSPDGSSIAYIKGRTVTIITLDGTWVRNFTVNADNTDGRLSWTDNGIWVGGRYATRKYSTAGAQLQSVSVPAGHGDMKLAAVAKNEARIAWTHDTPWTVSAMTPAGGSLWRSSERGCRGTPSPDGSKVSFNMACAEGGDRNTTTPSICHLEYAVRNGRTGAWEKVFKLKDVTGLNLDDMWCWNYHRWSGTSEYVILHLGQETSTAANVVRQMDRYSHIWIHNTASTARAICITPMNYQGENDWKGTDYFSGKLPADFAAPSIGLSSSSLAFSGTEGGANPSVKNVVAAALNGLDLSGISVSDNAAWLSVGISGSGTSRTLANSVDINGLVAGSHAAAVTVRADGKSAQYTVRLQLDEAPETGMSLGTEALRFTTGTDGSAPGVQTVTVTAVNGLDLSGISVSDNADWLSVAISGSGTSRTLTNTAAVSSLDPGVYAATVTVNAAGVTETYAVALTVTNPDAYRKRINIGGSAGDGWESGAAYTDGGAVATTDKAITVSGVPGAAPENVYQSCEHTGFSLAVDVVDGDYIVRCHMAEYYYTDLAEALANRAMTVTAEGTVQLTGMNPARVAGGLCTAGVVDFQVTVSDGELSLDIAPSAGAHDAYLMGVEVMGCTAAGRLVLGSASVAFAAAPEETPASRPLAVTGENGLSLADITVAETADWLEVTVSGTGDARTLTNTVSSAGLTPCVVSTPVTVTADGKSAVYTVTLTVDDPDAFHKKINFGGSGITGWEAGAAYTTGGSIATTDAAISTAGVDNAAPAAVYQSCEHTGFIFAMDIPDGDYTVRCHVTEYYYTSMADALANRAMDISLEGVTVAAGMIPAEEAGALCTAAVLEYAVTVADGELNMAVTNTGHDAYLMGLEVIGVPSQTFVMRPVTGAGAVLLRTDRLMTLDGRMVSHRGAAPGVYLVRGVYGLKKTVIRR